MFGENQRRYFIGQLRHIDELLGSAIEELDPEVDPSRVFQRTVHDATLAQRKTLADFVAQLRFSLRRFTKTHDLHDERRLPSGLWAFRSSMAIARVAAEELRPKYWSGYGAVDPQAATAGERFAAELIGILDRIDRYLLLGEGMELKDRLTQLEGFPEEGALLAQLERMITTHGLIELRAPLELLIHRAKTPRFEIAVLGRVSAGKSSLVNWWLGQSILPTGVTPVTSIPTHITHGDAVRVILTIAHSGDPLQILLEELPRYVTERWNPGNTKQILNIEIKVPAERLNRDIALVDTPGLGSLASAGLAQTFEYLPRCDLAVLLIAAGVPISQEDIDLARAVVEAGGDLTVVLSKADQLSAQDLESVRRHTEAQLAANLKIPLIVRPVSTYPCRLDLAKAWFDEEIQPRLTRRRQDARASLKRKIALLGERVAADLDSRLGSQSGEQSTVLKREPGANDAIAQARLELARAASSLRSMYIAHVELSPKVDTGVRQVLAHGWLAGDIDSVLREQIEFATRCIASRPGDAVVLSLQEVHDLISDVLRRTNLSPPEGLSQPRGRPIFEMPVILPSLYLRPRWLPPIRRLACLVAGMRVRRSLLADMQQHLLVHAEALSRWGGAYLEDLTGQFDAAIAPLESASRVADALQNASHSEAAREDLELLQRWPKTSSSH